jgi:hypothetical protein
MDRVGCFGCIGRVYYCMVWRYDTVSISDCNIQAQLCYNRGLDVRDGVVYEGGIRVVVVLT